MAGFRSTYDITLDAKGRITVPAKYRVQLKDMVITQNPFDSERCLLIYTASDWAVLEDAILARPNTNKKKMLMRHFIGVSVDCSPDSGGRVLVPKRLREFASIEKDLAMVGVGNKFELWATAAWQSSYDAFVEEVSEDEVLEEMEALPF